jgi:hypothetical protein
MTFYTLETIHKDNQGGTRVFSALGAALVAFHCTKALDGVASVVLYDGDAKIRAFSAEG